MNNTLKRNIIACYISDAVLGTFFQAPIWIAYQLTFLDLSQIAFFSGLSLITEVAMQLPTGAFADIFGRRFSLSLGNLFMAIPMFLIATYPTSKIMWIYAFIWGLGRAFAMGTSKPMLYETLSKNGKANLYPKILSKSLVIFQLSAAISITSGGYLYQVFHSLPYYVSGFASLIGVFTAFIFIEEKRESFRFDINKFINTTKDGFIEIFKNSFVTKLTILYAFTVGIANTNQQFFIQPFMVELGMNDIQRSWTAMVIKISIALIGAKIITTKRLFKNKYFILVIPLLLIVSLIPAKYVNLPWAYLTFLGVAFTSGNADLFISPEIHENLRNEIRSTAISAQRMLASSIGACIQWISAPIIISNGIGYFYNYIGYFTLIFILPLAYKLMSHKHTTNLNLNTNSLDSLSK